MRVFLDEIKRIVSSYIFWSILTVCVAVNFWTLIPKDNSPELYSFCDNLLSEMGTVVSEDSIKKLDERRRLILSQASIDFQERYGEEVSDYGVLFQFGYLEQADLDRLGILEELITHGHTLLDTSSWYNIDAFSKSREGVNNQVIHLAARMKEMKENNEIQHFNASQVSFSDPVLYGRIMPAIVIMVSLMGICTVLYSIETVHNYQFCHIAFATAKGRSICYTKINASVTITTITYFALCTMLVGTYMWINPQSYSLTTPYASHVYPLLIPKDNISALQHLIYSVCVGYVIVLIFTIIGGIIGISFHGSYAGGALLFGFIACMFCGLWISEESFGFVDMLMCFNPLSLIIRVENDWSVISRMNELFCYTYDSLSMPMFELIVLMIWLSSACVALRICYDRFCRRDVRL